MGKIIYETKGPASEYGKYGFSAFLGCSCGCSYCYNKKGRFAKILGGNKPTLKKYFRDEGHAIEVFNKELYTNLPELQKHGLFFSFTTDPMLPETISLTLSAVGLCLTNEVSVKILTKRTDFIDHVLSEKFHSLFQLLEYRYKVAFGFTLTGCDSLEPGASTNQERIDAMKKLHDAGFRTFASIEPIIDIQSSRRMVEETMDFCDLYKIGPESGKKYSINDLRELWAAVNINLSCRSKARVYWKDGFLKLLSLAREDALLMYLCTVDRDYNIFNQ